MEAIRTKEQFEQLTSGDHTTVIVFKTTWCPDCHFIEPFMPELEKQYTGQIQFFQIDRDELPAVCEQERVLGIPSFIAYKNSKELIRFVSKLRKTRDEIETFLQRTVAVADAVHDVI
jgi:thiol-disulfide isomerase/thioredoxin